MGGKAVQGPKRAHLSQEDMEKFEACFKVSQTWSARRGHRGCLSA